jgi:amino-acid N-acetyltransferase
MQYTIEKPRLQDAETIYQIINETAKDAVLLVRSRNYIYENLRDFWVVRVAKRVVGCCSLHLVGWEDLAEIKSFVVLKKYRKHGFGNLLIQKCLQEAEDLGVQRVFALTFIPGYFKKKGFKRIDKKKLPHKIWAECINCDKFPDCNEEAMILHIKKRGG